MQGTFIAFEGIDGSGKDTIIACLKTYLEEQGKPVTVSAEPTDGPVGTRIRRILTGQEPKPATTLDLQTLYIEDRKIHLKEVLIPALERGDIVLENRFWLSMIAYAMTDGTPEEFIALQKEILGEDMRYPDLTFIFDLPAELAIERKRIQQNGAHEDLYTKIDSLTRIRANYLALAKRADLGKIVVLDTRKPQEEVCRETIDILAEIFDIQS